MPRQFRVNPVLQLRGFQKVGELEYRVDAESPARAKLVWNDVYSPYPVGSG